MRELGPTRRWWCVWWCCAERRGSASWRGLSGWSPSRWPPEPPGCSSSSKHYQSCLKQCCGSMTFWGGSGCGSGSCYFRHWPSQDVNKKLIFKSLFLLITFWRYMYVIYKDKRSKRSKKAIGIKVFLPFFMVIEGSRRPKNMWIRWIRICNTGLKSSGLELFGPVLRIRNRICMDLHWFGCPGSGSRSMQID